MASCNAPDMFEDFVNPAMDPEAFRFDKASSILQIVWGKQMIDIVADYWQNLRKRKPQPKVKAGYIWDVVPAEAPDKPEPWSQIFKDLEPVVFSKTTNWNHPHFFAYYPTSCSYPAIMGDILSGGLSCIGFTWKSSPACTELEMAVMDWLAKLLQLPEHFYNRNPGPGAGMIQCTASDCTIVSLLAARNKACKSFVSQGMSESALFPSLVAYCSDQSHSSVERAGLLGSVTMRHLKTTQVQDYALTGDTLEKAIKEDLEAGLKPFYVCATVGTTSVCSFDRVKELGEVCRKYDLWMHVDAAYAGSACICPEYRYIIDGIELADSFNFNAHKWLMVNFDCAPMWFRDTSAVEQAFHVDPLYLKHRLQGIVPDYRHWQIPLGRRFRSLKLWFVLRAIGTSQLQQHIRSMTALAKQFEQLVLKDPRFEIVTPVVLGLVCFRLKGGDELSQRLLDALDEDGRIHLVPSVAHGILFLRLSICSPLTNPKDIVFAWNVIQQLTK